MDFEYLFDELPTTIKKLHSKIDILFELVRDLKMDRGDVSVPMDVYQAADFLRLAVRTIYDKVYKRQLPVYKKGKNLYFYKEELYSYIASGKLKTHEELKREAEAYLKLKS